MEISDRIIALLIDSENISSKYFEILTKQLENFGTLTYKRIYGDFTNTKTKAWKELLIPFGIQPVQQYSYTKCQNESKVLVGKNASDSTIIIDAMDILYKGKVNCICLATSDSDFTKLAVRFKEENYIVIGAGESKTPEAFRKVCDRFLPMDELLEENTHNEKLEPIISSMKEIIAENSDETGRVNFATAMTLLYKRHNDFILANYGAKTTKPYIFFKQLKNNPFVFSSENIVPYIGLKTTNR